MRVLYFNYFNVERLENKMKYITKTNNNSTIHIIEVLPSDFKIILNDSKKKIALSKNYCNAGFFATFKENNQFFTLPVAHLVCDYKATSQLTKHYCNERGKFSGDKFTFDSSAWSYNNPYYKNEISTLLVKDNMAEIKEVSSLPAYCDYAISGIPIMRNGVSVNYEKNIKSQGWDDSSLYSTWHIFVGLKKNTDTIYVIGMKTTSWNMVKTNEAYKYFKEIDMYDVIKLDGGGSFYMNVDGKAVASTSEDRRINTIICFDNVEDNNKSVHEEMKNSIKNTEKNKQPASSKKVSLINKYRQIKDLRFLHR